MTGILLDNAVKYTPRGGEIEATLYRQRDKITLSVRDSKAYIPPEHLKRLFDRLYRLDEARANTGGGYGLDLSIAAEIARRHGAPLKASSSEENGACFTLTIQSVDGGK